MIFLPFWHLECYSNKLFQQFRNIFLIAKLYVTLRDHPQMFWDLQAASILADHSHSLLLLDIFWSFSFWNVNWNIYHPKCQKSGAAQLFYRKTGSQICLLWEKIGRDLFSNKVIKLISKEGRISSSVLICPVAIVFLVQICFLPNVL